MHPESLPASSAFDWLSLLREAASLYAVSPEDAPVLNIFECINDAFVALDHHARFIYVNSQAERMLKRPRADLLGHIVWEIYPEARRSQFFVEYQRATTNNVAVEFEAFYPFFGAWIEARAFPSLHGLAVFLRDITSRKQAQEALQRQSTHLAALHASTLAIMNHLDLDTVLQTIVEHAATLLNTERGFLYLVDDDRAGISLRVGLGPIHKHVGRRLRLGEGLVGKVWQSGQPLFIDDYATWEHRIADFNVRYPKKVVGVPLKLDATVLGVLGFAFDDPDQALPAEQRAILERFAPLAAIAVENARLYTASQYELVERQRAEQALRENEVRYRALFDRTNDGVLLFDLSGIIIAANSQIATMLGYAQAEMIGRRLVQHVVPRERSAAIEKFNALLAGHSLPIFERTFITRDGVEVPVELNTALVRDAAGKPLHVQSVVRNIAARKRAERAVRKNEALFRAIFAQSAIGTVLLETNGCIIEVNAALQQLIGYQANELYGRFTREFMHPDDMQLRADLIDELLRGKRSHYQVERRLFHKSGHMISTSVSISLMRSVDDEPPLLVAMVEDITERKQAEQALRESENRFRAIVESLSEGLMITDEHDVILYLNPQMAALTGYSVEELIGKTAHQLFLPPQEWMVMDQHNQRRMAGISERYEVQIKRKDGRYIWIEVNATPLRNSAGEIIATLGAMTDITEHKRMSRRNLAFGVLGQLLSSAINEQDAARSIAAVADDMIGWDAFALWLYNAEADMMHAVLDVDILDGQRQEVPLSSEGFSPGPVSRLILNKGPQLLFRHSVLFEQLGLVPFGDTGRPSESLMFVPIKRDARVVGILTIQSYTPYAYTEDDLQTLQVLADHCSGALERVRAETALRAAEARYRDMVENASDIIYVHDLNGIILSINKTAERWLGFSAAEMVRANISTFVMPESLAAIEGVIRQGVREHHSFKPFEVDLLRKDGSTLPVEINARLLFNGDTVVAIEGIGRDISERRRAEAMIRHMAFYDALTCLPNRVLFDEYLHNALALAKRHDRQLAVLFVDLDRFKLINDTLGHHAGDLLLQEVAQRLTSCVRDGDVVARMGGDEFTILLPEIEGLDDAAEVAQRLLQTLSPPFVISGNELFVSASIGVSLYPSDGEDAETLLKHADTAMYRAKDQGRNGHQFYAPAMKLATHKQHKLEQWLRRALERQEFELFYQPRVVLSSGALVAVEALLRWRHPEFGLIDPVDFISVTEETGLIMPIGEWVLRTACSQIKEWQQVSGIPLRVSVNLSARQFQQIDLPTQIADILHESGIAASSLELEITESMAMLNAARTVVVLRALKDLGIHLSVDDFGTGYSSLSYLKQFSLDTLKIDRTFVHDFSVANDSAIAEAIITLAHTLDLSVTAEGVETEEQLAFLRRHGCDEAQGYLIGKPVPVDEFESLYLHKHVFELSSSGLDI